MKKSLIAAAILGLLSGSAFAADSVTIYGIVDVGVAHYDNGGQTVTNMSQGGVSNSRLGFKGSEDLGGGLSALFQIETGICAQGGPLASGGYCSGGSFMGRQSWVGLKSGLGTLRMGRYYTYSDDDLVAFDPFTDNTVAAVGNLVEKYLTVRANQSLTFDSASFGGFDFGLQYAFGDGFGYTQAATATTAATYQTTGEYNLRARYIGGPLKVSVEYLHVNDANGNAKTKDTRISGAYDFGVAQLFGIYGQNSPDSSTVAASNPKYKYFLIGGAVPLGAGSLRASYVRLKDDTTSAANASQYGIGYWYSLSKRTTLYANYAHISNDANALYTVGVGNDAPKGPTGSSSSGFMVGMKHTF